MGRTFDMSARKLWLALMELFATAMATNTPATAQQPSQKPNILLRFGFLLLATTVGGVELAAAAEKEMPKFDIAAVCRGSGPVETRAQCMQDEQAASDALARLWPQFKQYASQRLRNDIGRMSRFGSKADICSAQAHVCFGPKADAFQPR